jgi:hypothetical protein
MPTPLASTFSTIDSIKRILGDALSNPGQFIQSAGANVAPMTQEDALNTVTNFAPAGMIVPASRVVDFALFNKASKALKNGESPKFTFEDTGVYDSGAADGILRSFISDTQAMMRPGVGKNAQFGKNTTVADLLDHPDLFRVMPELTYTKVVHAPGQHNGAYFRAATDSAPAEIGLGTHDSLSGMLSTLLHEVQHNVQNLSGMTRGGNPKQFIADKVRVSKAVKTIAAIANAMPPGNADPLKRELYKDFKTLTSLADKADASYRALGGEVESRLTQEMFRQGAGPGTFPPAFQSRVPGLNTTAPATKTGYHDLEDAVQVLLDKYAPRDIVAKP